MIGWHGVPVMIIIEYYWKWYTGINMAITVEHNYYSLKGLNKQQNHCENNIII